MSLIELLYIHKPKLQTIRYNCIWKNLNESNLRGRIAEEYVRNWVSNIPRVEIDTNFPQKKEI